MVCIKHSILQMETSSCTAKEQVESRSKVNTFYSALILTHRFTLILQVSFYFLAENTKEP